MSDQEYYGGKAEIQILRLTNYMGKSVDLLPMYVELKVTEDMFSSCCSGTISVKDSQNLVEDLPIIGEETIKIKFRPDAAFDFVEREFYVYELTDRNRESEGSESYVIHFCSEEMLVNRSKIISRSFKNKTPSEIVQILLSSDIATKKKLDIEKSIGIQNYIAPSVYPFEIIASMCTRGKSEINPDGASYVFFENKDGFVFKPIETLIKNTPIKYSFTKKANITETSTSFYSVNSITVLRNFNVVESMTSGLYGATVNAIDLMNKTVKDQSFDYFNDAEYSKLGHMTGKDANLRLQTSKFKFKSKQGIYKFVSGESTAQTDKPKTLREFNIAKRYSQIAQLTNSIKIAAEVPFNPEITIGSVIDLAIKTGETSDSAAVVGSQDKFLSGKYLVTSLNHYVSDGKGVTSMELCRDTYKSDHEKLTATTNKNIGAA